MTGRPYDDNGYAPFAAPVRLIAPRWDVNITIFCVQAVVLTLGALAITRAAA